MKKLLSLLLCICLMLCTGATLAVHAQEQTTAQQTESAQSTEQQQSSQSSEQQTREPTTEHILPPSYGAGEKVTEFVVVSDLHLGRNPDASNNFVNMLNDIKNTAPDAAGIIVVGDVVDAAEEAYYDLFRQLYDSVADVPPIYCVAGEHEYLTKDTYEYAEANREANRAKFVEFISSVQNTNRMNPYYSIQLGGCTMAFLSADEYVNGMAHFSQPQIDFLLSTLCYSVQENPVFVFMHEPLPNTVTGTAGNQAYGQVSNHAQLRSLIEQFPVIMFNGHSHFSMADEHSSYKFNADSRAFNTGAVSYLRANGENGDIEVQGSQGYYVTVYENAVLVRGRDFASGKWIEQAYHLFKCISPVIETKPQTSATTAPITASPSTTTATKPQKTTAAKTEAETEAEEEDELKELVVPVGILAAMAVIVFIFVFRKPKEQDNA